MDKVVLDQRYFESTYGVTRGDFASGLIHPEQMWTDRPVPGWGGYATPIKNLYMCGSACHPGPGITCVPGWNGAQRVLVDMKR
jgi:phytoene dehydrogenase-like protein